MAAEARLKTETEKWLARLEEQLPAVQVGKVKEREVREVGMKNVQAYAQDCKHFISKHDWLLAFEAIVYAWGIYETLLRLGLIENPRYTGGR